MRYTILGASYANVDSTAAVIRTQEAGDVLVSEADTPQAWEQMLQGTVAPYVQVAHVPAEVSRRAAKQVLAQAGLLASVQPAIDAITDSMQREMMQIEWDDSQAFQRHRPSLIGIASALGLSSAQLDQLFMQAANLP